ncbi:hypothetical protein [Clostridium cellulovorans]|uniref:Stage III sporulation protein AH n=1 Tax=Clostridium cellulovorans (strain ATCC 35296 / DSM 3052 / OCM 3 / 743B) TaxID=573061 RepID=D9SQR5_CLOC7|nr:hypothetical protein [Clostridium cellulovorans]ADL52271.1 hypothetical protein Clocel_2559 [Clostridium cellulovorans 743B]
MFIRTNPKGEVYRDLIDLAFEICDTFILVVRNDISTTENVDYVLEKLNPSLKEVKKQFQWASIIVCSDISASVYYYHTDDNAKKILKESANSLHQWVQPNLPEDLSFIKNNELWLSNTAHEYESYILTDDSEEILKIWNIKGLDIQFS